MKRVSRRSIRWVASVPIVFLVFWMGTGCRGDLRVEYHLMKSRVDATEPALRECLDGEMKSFTLSLSCGFFAISAVNGRIGLSSIFDLYRAWANV